MFTGGLAGLGMTDSNVPIYDALITIDDSMLERKICGIFQRA